MTDAPSGGVDPSGDPVDGWPIELAGVTETVIATRDPEGRWNQAALGVLAPDEYADVTARTWGDTRTRRNFEERGSGYVQFTVDPVDFVTAALDEYETAAPVLERSAAWTRVDATSVDRTSEGATTVETWTLEPREAAVSEQRVPLLSRGRAAVIEASVAASRLDVPAYATDELVDRLEWLDEVAETAGSDRDRAAFERIDELVGWRDRTD